MVRRLREDNRVTEYLVQGPFDTTYEYDTLGNLIGVTDAFYNETRIFYDSLSRKTEMHDPAMGVWRYTYDANGNLKTQTNEKIENDPDQSQPMEFHYDSLNRLTRKAYPDGTGVTYVYDNTDNVLGGNCDGNANHKGRLTKVTDSSGENMFCYDFAGRVLESFTKVDASTYHFQKTYNALGLTTGITYPEQAGSETVTYEYDTGLNLHRVKNQEQVIYADFLAIEPSTLAYNAAGQPLGVKYANGVTTALGYQPQNSRLQTMITKLSGGTEIQNFAYTYNDLRGNLKVITDGISASETHPDQNQSFEYDKLNRLQEARGPYGPNGTQGTLYFEINEIGNIKSSTPTTEATGTIAPNKSNHTIVYDYENRATSITNANGTTTFTYNYQGSRVKRTRLAASSETIYIGKLLEIENGAVTKHIFAGGRRIATKIGSDTYYYHPDHLGSLNVATDSTGRVSQIVTYYPYGEIRTNEVLGSADLRHKFTGQEYDQETGLYYYGARYYDPAAGRFITPDTVVQSPGDPQALNRYAYCRNNPLAYTDPSGHIFGIDDVFFAIIVGTLLNVTTSAIMGGDLTSAAAIGAFAGGLFAAAPVISGALAPVLCTTVQAASIGVHAAMGMGMGAFSSFANHGDILQGAISGGISAGMSEYIGGNIPHLNNKYADFGVQLAGRSAIGAVTGGISSAMMGGGFGAGAAQGAWTAAYGFAFNYMLHSVSESPGVDELDAAIMQGLTDTGAGFADATTMGITAQIRGAMGADYLVNENSGNYALGASAGLLATTALFGYNDLQITVNQGVNYFKIISPALQTGFRVDKPHWHNPTIHKHFWWW